jgi:hypothetical protein
MEGHDDGSVHPTKRLLVEASLRRVAEASLDEFLAFLTPVAVAARAERLIADERRDSEPPRESTVRYHFKREGTRAGFDLDALAAQLVDFACEAVEQISRTSAADYMAAITSLKEAGSLEPVAQALASELGVYRPGGTPDPFADARERVFFMAIAAADDGGETARRLRECDRLTEQLFAGIYDAGLAITGRRMVGGYSTRDLAKLISMFLNGEAMRYRYGNSVAVSTVVDTVLRLFWVFTASHDEQDLDVAANLMRAIELNGD